MLLAYIQAKLGLSRVFESHVPGHKGQCYPVWLNRNEFLQRMEGPGLSGFFKLLTDGPFADEFHGILWTDGTVWSTDGVYTRFKGPDETISSLHCGTCLISDLGCPECHGEGRTSMTVRERSRA